VIKNVSLWLTPRGRLFIILIPAIAVVLYIPIVTRQWNQARGYEYEWVAWQLALGHGYSFDSGTAWLGPYANASDYSPTAWIEPVHTAIMAVSFHLFGDQGRLVLVLLNVLWLGMTSVIIFLLIEQLVGFWPGTIMAALFVLLPFHRTELLIYIGNAAMAAFLFSLNSLLLIWCLEKVSSGRCLALGATVGIATLTHAGMLLFVPLTALIVLVGFGVRRIEVWRSVGAGLIVAILVILPWTLRNAVTFGQLIPVRNGFGFQSYIGNPGLASTFVPTLQSNATVAPPPWTASGPWQALEKLRDLEFDRAVRHYSIITIRELAPEGYSLFNEAQRDKVFLSHTVEFVREMPLLTARMAFWKVLAFFGNWGLIFRITALTAFAGWLVMLRDYRATSLMLLLAAYTIPYAISLPLYYRYRFPAEPLLFVLAGLLLGVISKRLWR
jgi:hypothetical protein